MIWCDGCCAGLKRRGGLKAWGGGRGRSGGKRVVPLKRGNREGNVQAAKESESSFIPGLTQSYLLEAEVLKGVALPSGSRFDHLAAIIAYQLGLCSVGA